MAANVSRLGGCGGEPDRPVEISASFGGTAKLLKERGAGAVEMKVSRERLFKWRDHRQTCFGSVKLRGRNGAIERDDG